MRRHMNITLLTIVLTLSTAVLLAACGSSGRDATSVSTEMATMESADGGFANPAAPAMKEVVVEVERETAGAPRAPHHPSQP